MTLSCATHTHSRNLGFSSCYKKTFRLSHLCAFHVSCSWKWGAGRPIAPQLLLLGSCPASHSTVLSGFSSPSAHRADDAESTDPSGTAGEAGRPERVAVRLHWEVSQAFIGRKILSLFDHLEKWPSHARSPAVVGNLKAGFLKVGILEWKNARQGPDNLHLSLLL